MPNSFSTQPDSPRNPRLLPAMIAFLALTAFLAPQFFTAALAAPQNGASQSAAPDLGKIRAAWIHNLATKQLDTFLNLYAPDAVFLSLGDRVAGTAALRTLFETVMASVNSDITLTSHTSEVSGDLAYDSGDYHETLTTIATRAKTTLSGSYVLIYKRQPSGTWLIVQHIWTLAPPVAQ